MATLAQLLLTDLCLERFVPSFCRLGAVSLEQLAMVRYEELLEMGLSKVQCHLFFEKISSLITGVGHHQSGSGIHVVEVCEEQLSHGLLAGVSHEEVRRAALQQLMPPPCMGSPALEAARSTKRPHSSHLSEAARGCSSHRSTAEFRSGSSASGSSSQSLHLDACRVQKRRKLRDGDAVAQLEVLCRSAGWALPAALLADDLTGPLPERLGDEEMEPA